MATPLPPSFTVPATTTETRRDPLQHGELPPLLEGGLTVKNVWKNLDWKHVLGLGLTPLIAIYGLLTTEIQAKTLIWSIIYYFATGLGITAGKIDIHIPGEEEDTLQQSTYFFLLFALTKQL